MSRISKASIFLGMIGFAFFRLVSPSQTPFSNVGTHFFLSKTFINSSISCDHVDDCWRTALGNLSICFDHLCTCPFGYIVLSSGECTPFNCGNNTDCRTYFPNSHCNLKSAKCVCEADYTLDTLRTKCEAIFCSSNGDCLKHNTRCNSQKRCVCKIGYLENRVGNCVPEDTREPFEEPSEGQIISYIMVIAIVGAAFATPAIILISLCRRKRNLITEGVSQGPLPLPQFPAGQPRPALIMFVPTTGLLGQSGFIHPAGYQVGLQTATSINPILCGDQQDQPPPDYSPPSCQTGSKS